MFQIPDSAHDAVIVSYARTPFGRAGKGSLVEVRPEDLALTAVRGANEKAPSLDLATFDDFFLGTAVPEGAQGDNIARRIAIHGGYDTLPGVTINRFCASSLQALAGAARAIKAGDGAAYLVAGVESTSSTPPVPKDLYPGHEIPAQRVDELFKSGKPWIDPRVNGHAPDVYISMGKTAEFVAQQTGTSRRDQDEWALESQRRAARAIDSGYFSREIVPVIDSNGVVIDADDGPRPTTTRDGLASLNPVFRDGGTVTAGNASPLNDGASAAIVVSRQYANNNGLTPLARILGASASALSPEIMGLGPIEATKKLLARFDLNISDLDIIELNEAFAAQVIPVVKELGADSSRVNPHGGAIAIGHPFGATGVRLVGTLINGLQSLDGNLGLATLCVGGGQGMAMLVERLK